MLFCWGGRKRSSSSFLPKAAARFDQLGATSRGRGERGEGARACSSLRFWDMSNRNILYNTYRTF